MQTSSATLPTNYVFLHEFYLSQNWALEVWYSIVCITISTGLLLCLDDIPTHPTSFISLLFCFINSVWPFRSTLVHFLFLILITKWYILHLKGKYYHVHSHSISRGHLHGKGSHIGTKVLIILFITLSCALL